MHGWTDARVVGPVKALLLAPTRARPEIESVHPLPHEGTALEVGPGRCRCALILGP